MLHEFKRAIHLAFLLPIAACGTAIPEQSLVDAVEQVTIEDGTRHLSSPALGGRGTGQPGADSAAQWIAERFRAIGVESAGDDGTYLQPLSLTRSRVTSTSGILAGRDTLRIGSDFAVLTAPDGNVRVAGPIVFVGHGIRDRATGRDDLAGVDVANSIVMVLGDIPPGIDSATFTESTAETRRELEQARALLVARLAPPGVPFEEVARRLTGDRIQLVSPEVQGPTSGPVVLAISDATADRLLAGTFSERTRLAELGRLDATPQPASVAISLDRTSVDVHSANVAGIIRGADAALRDELVVYTAHYDAFGRDSVGTIYRGAIDNALGTSQLLAVAAAFARQPAPPLRSVLFLAVTGEEYGLLGTRAWIAAERWPIAQVVAALNFDASDSEVHGPMAQAVGLGAEQSSLGEVFRQAAADLDVTPIADPYPEQGFFFRSDHFAFVQRGVPGLMLIGAPSGTAWVERSRQWLGPAGDYHQPSDTMRADWDFRGPRRSAQLMALIGWRVANAEIRPQLTEP